jgi:SET domain-containing protein
VFATRPIDEGDWIVEYAGERITEAEFRRRVPLRNDGDATHSVFFEIAPDVIIDANVRGNSARFINHSCDPNCEKRLENGRVQIYARRAIGIGEELSFDYAFAPEEHLSARTLAAHPCRCGSERCRGTLFGSAP